MALPLIAGLIVVLLGWGVMTYNRLVQAKHAVSRALANIDVLLKQRHDELPKLVETCRQYRQFEQDTLQRVIEARGQVQRAADAGNVAALGKAEGALRAGVSRIFAVAEAYPELKADQSFLQLQTRITSLENGIADRRELYNETVNINNVLIEQFPASVIAGMGDFPARSLLHFASSETADVDLKSLFAS
jgi:LemA protein